MLMFSVSKKSNKSFKELFNRINSIDKLLKYENEFKDIELKHVNRKRGNALVRVKIFGKEIKGKMSYKIGKGKVTAIVDSKDIKYLKFGYIIKNLKRGSMVTQFVEFDTGNSVKNFLAKIFFSRKIKNHMEEEVLKVIE